MGSLSFQKKRHEYQFGPQAFQSQRENESQGSEQLPHVALAEEAEPTSPECTSICFTIETLAQIDDYLTSDSLFMNTQHQPFEETEVMEAYYMAMEDFLVIG
jgi:hypothetical protein